MLMGCLVAQERALVALQKGLQTDKEFEPDRLLKEIYRWHILSMDGDSETIYNVCWIVEQTGWTNKFLDLTSEHGIRKSDLVQAI